uniref:Uncharacterized protein n=1 Tax=Leersia perrieri TaxID=77586 RepID=A0A0D9WVH6_9ORYZ
MALCCILMRSTRILGRTAAHASSSSSSPAGEGLLAALRSPAILLTPRTSPAAGSHHRLFSTIFRQGR